MVAVGGGIALLMVTYRTLEVRRASWAAAAVVVGAIIALVFGAGAVVFPRDAVASTAPAISLSIQEPTISANGRRLHVQIAAVGGDSMARITFDPDSATIHFRDGSIAHGRNYGAVALVRAGNPALGPNVKLLESTTDPVRAGINFGIADGGSPDRVVDNVEITGRVWMSDAEQVVSLPLRAGERSAHNGIRARISKPEFSPGWTTFDIQTAEIATASSQRAIYSSALNVVVINDQHREAIVAHSSQTGGSTEWAVLPGAPISLSVASYTAMTRDSSGEIAPRDSSWYKAARVSIIRWKPVATYRTRLSVSR
jgi:hypothetical protein